MPRILRHSVSALAVIALVPALAGNAMAADPTGESSIGLWQINRDKTGDPNTAIQSGKAPKTGATNKAEDVQVIQELLNAPSRKTKDRLGTGRNR